MNLEDKTTKRNLLVLTVTFFIFSFLILHQWNLTSETYNKESKNTIAAINTKEKPKVDLSRISKKPKKREAKGLYVTAYTASSDKSMDRIIKLINETELNAVVVDIKDYSGKVLYDSDVDLVDNLNLERVVIGDVENLIDKLHKNGIYVIARQTVFQDPILAEKKSEWAFKNNNGSLWRDYNGLAWVNPDKKGVWEYNMKIAKEAVGLGFDEINFDYVRFPSDGPTKRIAYTHGSKEKYEVMAEFYDFIEISMEDEPAWVSLDLFGLVMERHDGMHIGQRLEDAVNEVDYISPMMYPSHYPSGHMGLKNPAAHPGKVMDQGMKKGTSYFKNSKADVRPWVQAFNIGAVYDGKKIRAQIDAIEKYTDAGWLLWNARNVYSKDGLKLKESNE